MDAAVLEKWGYVEVPLAPRCAQRGNDEGGGQDESVLMTPNPLQAFDGSARAEEGGGSAVDEEAGL